MEAELLLEQKQQEILAATKIQGCDSDIIYSNFNDTMIITVWKTHYSKKYETIDHFWFLKAVQRGRTARQQTKRQRQKEEESEKRRKEEEEYDREIEAESAYEQQENQRLAATKIQGYFE